METTGILLFIGGLGGPEVIMIILIFVLFFGAKRIPELAKGLGRGIREFKDASKNIKTDIEHATSGSSEAETTADKRNLNT